MRVTHRIVGESDCNLGIKGFAEWLDGMRLVSVQYPWTVLTVSRWKEKSLKLPLNAGAFGIVWWPDFPLKSLALEQKSGIDAAKNCVVERDSASMS